jgi:hypothetical protein
MGKRARKNAAQGSLSSLAGFAQRRSLGGVANGKFSGRLDQGAAHENSNYLVAVRKEPAPLKKPQRRRAGTACFPELPSSSMYMPFP